MMGWYGDGAWGWGGWLVMTLTMVAFWGLVVWALVAIFRGTTRSGDRNNHGRRSRDAMEILDKRFARGEIDADEYHARQDVLRTSVH
jgi:putative membrane protein